MELYFDRVACQTWTGEHVARHFSHFDRSQCRKQEDNTCFHILTLDATPWQGRSFSAEKPLKHTSAEMSKVILTCATFSNYMERSRNHGWCFITLLRRSPSTPKSPLEKEIDRLKDATDKSDPTHTSPKFGQTLEGSTRCFPFSSCLERGQFTDLSSKLKTLGKAIREHVHRCKLGRGRR